MGCIDVFFFFFKQKTAYELRISDWSSDVCSSDLVQRQPLLLLPGCARSGGARVIGRPATGRNDGHELPCGAIGPASARHAGLCLEADQKARSEEHTSELQSLMRISYAVFCLKKKKNHYENNANQYTNTLPIMKQLNDLIIHYFTTIQFNLY